MKKHAPRALAIVNEMRCCGWEYGIARKDENTHDITHLVDSITRRLAAAAPVMVKLDEDKQELIKIPDLYAEFRLLREEIVAVSGEYCVIFFLSWIS